VQRLKWRDHTPLEFWILVALVALMLLLGIPWLIEHPIHDSHQ
jgi:Tfp pilus assembly protein FimT